MMIQINQSASSAKPADDVIADLDVDLSEVETFEQILIERIQANPSQVRKIFDERSIEEMIGSILEVGLLSPLRVQRNGDKYVIVDGERRFRSLVRLERKTVPCIVERTSKDEARTVQKMLIANCQRQDLNPIERAIGYSRLMTLCNCTATEAAKKVGTSIGSFTKFLALLRLDESVQQRIARGEVPASSGYELVRLDDKNLQIEFANQIASGDLQRDAIRNAIQSRVKKQQGEVQPTPRATKRVAADLGGGRTMTFAGPDLDLESSIEMAEEFLGQARKARTQGLELPTLIKMMADKSRIA